MKKNLLFAILCVLGLFGTLNAQDVVTIDGTVGGYASTTENNKLPVYCANKWAVTQQFYTAEEIGKSSGTIESIAFKTTDKGTYPYTRNLDVYMVNSDEYAIVGNGMKTMSASDLVFSGDVTFAQDSWVTIDITDFEYTGKNVLICVNDKTGTNVTGGAYFEGFNCSVTINGSNANRALWKRSTSTAFDVTSTNAMSGASQPKIVPFIQFAFTSGTTEEYADPSKPTNFTYTILNESKVQLSWNAAPETESYNVYEGSDLIANVTETTYTVRNLSLGTHCFTVTGANGPKESEATEELCVNLVAKAVESITIGTTGDGDSQTAPMALFTQNSWVEQLYTAAEIGGARTIERISFATKAASAYSEPFTTEEIKIYLAETTRTDYADKNWTPQADLELVYSDTDIIIGDQEWETFEFDSPFNYNGTKNLAVVVVKSSETSAQYFWHTNTVANSVLYAETSAYPTAQGNVTTTRPVVRFSWETEETEEVVLTAPANVVATPKSTSEIVLTWDVVEGATGYRVYQGETFSNVTGTTYTVEGLDTYTEYCFGVTAERNGGEQETAKVTACAKTLDLTIAAPVVTAEATSISTIALTWNAVENALSYNVYQGETLLGNVTSTTFTVEGLASYTDYSFTVSAVRNEQEMVSAAATAKTLDLAIAAPVVTAEATSASEITLTWNAVENALSYNVYQGETLLGNVTELTYTVEGLAPYTDYSFTVSAVRNEQEKTSAAITTKTQDLTIAAPVVTAEATSASAITLTWEAVENALSYNVYQGEEVVVEGLTTTTYTVEGLASYTDYSFTVSAVRNEQEMVSEAATAKTLDLTIEKTAGVTAAATGTTTIALTWETVTNALSYNVYYGDTVVNVTSTTYTVEGLEDNTDYCFNITAVRNEQETEKVEACAKTTEEIIPVAPTNVVATATSTSEIVITWAEATNALSYNVYQGETLLANVTETTYTASGLELYTDYCFDVTSVREEKETEKVTACARTLDLTIAAPVVTAEATSASVITLTWEAVENAMSYVVYQGEDSIANITETTFTVEGLDPYTEYSFTVTALRNAQAETSAVVTAKTLDLTIAAPVVVAEATSATEIVLTWEAVENAMSYVVYQGEDSIANITETTFTVEGLDPYTEYSFTVTALRNAQAETSAVVTAKTLDLTIAAPVVVAEATSATEIVLTWEAVENAMSYVVYQGEDSIANVTETTFTVVDLDPETEYCFTVSALRNAQVETSEKACATTLVKKEIIIGDYPTTFFYDFENGNLNGWTVIDKNNDGVKWEFKDGDNGGMNDGKGVYSGTLYGDSADDYLITASKYSMTETSEFSFVFVPYDYTYFQEKIAVVVSEDGETFETVWSYEFEEYSRWQDTTISLKKYAGKDLYVGLHHYDSQDGIRVDNIKLDSKEPAVPANLTAEATPTSITLTWDVVANAASYNVYSVVGEDYTLVENVKKATYTAEGLDYETEYSYAVTSVNDYKESRYSKVIEVTTLGEPLPEGVEILLKETFEAYTAGDKIAEKGAEHWTTWSKKPGSAEDGIVAELDGNKYGHFTYGNDQVLRLGGYQAGVFELEFDVYVPEGKGGYYNLLHQFEGNTSWAVQAYFQMEEKDGQANPKIADGHGTVHAGSLNTYDVPCVYNDWMHFRIEINANIDEAVYHYTMPGGEEVEAFKWQWSKDCFGDGVVGRKLDAMGFFPPTKGTEFYVDNIILKRIGGESAPIITFNQEEVNGSMAGDDISSVELEIENIGTSIAEYVAWIDYGEGAMSDDYEIISYALEDLSTTTTIGWNPIEEPMTFEIAALYPSSAYAGSVMGTYISAASYFLGEFKTQDGNTVPMLEPGTDMIFRIYGQGINGKPGEVLAEKVLPADSIILDWNVVTFDEPVLLTGFDFYLAVEMTQCVGGSAMVLDGNKDGAYQGYADLCRQTSGTPFRSLTEFTQGEKFGNFHLMVLCMGDAVTGGWAELSKKDGTLEIGAKETIEINFTSIGLEEGKKYDAKIVFNTNTEEGVIELPLSLYVWGENVEEILSNTYNIYPNPTTAQVTVEGENIDYIAVYNSVGLLVKVVRTQNNIVDMSTNENGVYFFNIVDQDGQSSVQRVVVAK